MNISVHFFEYISSSHCTSTGTFAGDCPESSSSGDADDTATQGCSGVAVIFKKGREVF